MPLRRQRPPDIHLETYPPDPAPPRPPQHRFAGLARHDPIPRSLVPGQRPVLSPYRDAYHSESPDTPAFYNYDRPESAQRLLSPEGPPSQSHRYRDYDPSSPSPRHSVYSSRRSSVSSDRGSRVYSPSPFHDSHVLSQSGSEEEAINTQTVAQLYNITPSAGLLIYPEDVENDDYLHNPDEKHRKGCDVCTKRGFVNIGGLIFVTLGVLMLFIGYPVLTFIRKLQTEDDPCHGDPNCLNTGALPLLRNIRQGLIDPTTPSSAMTKTSADGSTQLQLVFSDEFNTDGRTFYPGDDPYFEAVNLWYGVTGDLEWYDPDAITTNGGVLEIRMDAFQNHGLNYRSGMLQSWNQLCFQGGHLEASISLPGSGDVMGFWPGFWSMGNLGRPGYAATTDGLWPYSYDDVCDAGITPNQSQTDGISYLPGMRLPACTCSGQQHPSPGNSRSAPEIDVIEASAGPLDGENIIGQASQSFQVAPFDIWWYPDYDFTPVYDSQITSLNSYTGGPYQQALSAISNLNNDWYNGKQYQTYAYEYTPGSSGSLTWFVGSEQTWTLDSRAIRPNGNIGQRVLPNEPMAMVFNMGMSNSFVAINWTGIGEQLPATMRFDYVRLYQPASSQSVTCDPENYPTTSYIQQFGKAYQDQNVTSWAKAGFTWPQNSFMDGCST